MKLRSILTGLFTVYIGSVSMAQKDPVFQKILEIGKTDNRTMQHLDVLCNRFGGRLIGSDAYENAAIWAASKREGYYVEKGD